MSWGVCSISVHIKLLASNPWQQKSMPKTPPQATLRTSMSTGAFSKISKFEKNENLRVQQVWIRSQRGLDYKDRDKPRAKVGRNNSKVLRTCSIWVFLMFVSAPVQGQSRGASEHSAAFKHAQGEAIYVHPNSERKYAQDGRVEQSTEPSTGLKRKAPH